MCIRDRKDEDSRYASSVTVSSIQTDRVSVNMTDNGNDDLHQRKLRSKPPRLIKKPWTTFNRCSPNSSLTGVTMIPGVIIMGKNIITMNNPRLRSQRKVLLWMLKFLKASKLRSHP